MGDLPWSHESQNLNRDLVIAILVGRRMSSIWNVTTELRKE